MATKTENRKVDEALVIDRILTQASQIAAGDHEKIKPGTPVRFTEACVAGDAIRQGDLYIALIDMVPSGYTKAAKPFVQLVPGNTEGARHCLDGLNGVEIYLPDNWPAVAETDYLGPVLVLTEERTILHPKHGAVTIPAGCVVELTYQREYDQELKRSRRNLD